VKKARELVRQHYRRRAGGGERELLGGAAATAATATTATVEGVMGVMGFSAGNDKEGEREGGRARGRGVRMVL